MSWLIEEGPDRGRYGYFLPDDRFDRVVEFYGVGGLEEDPFFVGMVDQVSFQREEAYGSMRVGKVMILRIEPADRSDGFCVGVGLIGWWFMVSPRQIQKFLALSFSSRSTSANRQDQ